MFDLARGFFDSDIFETLDRRIQAPSWSQHGFFGTSGLDSSFKTNAAGEYELKIELPGFAKDEVDVQLTEHTLVVTAAHKADSRVRNFTTSIPDDLDHIGLSAALDLGVLTVVAAKLKPAFSKATKIQVK